MVRGMARSVEDLVRLILEKDRRTEAALRREVDRRCQPPLSADGRAELEAIFVRIRPDDPETRLCVADLDREEQAICAEVDQAIGTGLSPFHAAAKVLLRWRMGIETGGRPEDLRQHLAPNLFSLAEGYARGDERYQRRPRGVKDAPRKALESYRVNAERWAFAREWALHARLAEDRQKKKKR